MRTTIAGDRCTHLRQVDIANYYNASSVSLREVTLLTQTTLIGCNFHIFATTSRHVFPTTYCCKIVSTADDYKFGASAIA